jgi:hypothetical protein
LKIPNAALRFKPPEPTTNKTFFARLLGKDVKETKPNATNTIQTAKSSGTNKVETPTTESAAPPLTGNEPPEELMKRAREMRERGEEIPPEIRSKLRELFQSGALQRPGGGQGFGGQGGGAGATPGARPPRAAQPSSRTVYLLSSAKPADGGDPVVKPEPVRIKTGISDGAYTEVTDGLTEGQPVITSVKLPQAQVTPAPTGGSPFGGGGGRRGF